MDYNRLAFEDFARAKPFKFNLVDSPEALSDRTGAEAADAVRRATTENRQVLLILPVGPLDYRRWAAVFNREKVSCEALVTLSMDEYLDERDQWIATDHSLSFRRFIRETFVEALEPKLRPRLENVHFPDPRRPEAATELVDRFGGAEICYGGMGITGHFAFNDPPEPGEAMSVEQMRQLRTRVLTISRESMTQMAMGGTNGNIDILPRRAVSLGMYELLKSRKLHLTFMRTWHAGVLRRALFGPVTVQCPGSLAQAHPNVEVTLTRAAAQVPPTNVAQATGEAKA